MSNGTANDLDAIPAEVEAEERGEGGEVFRGLCHRLEAIGSEVEVLQMGPLAQGHQV